LAAKNLEPFISEELRRSWTPILFKSNGGGYQGNKALGYPAELLPEVCDVFLAAREAGALLPSQEHMAKKCEILVRAFAKVGIIALVDEATGYQEVRDRLALQKILEMYIAKELLPWTKQFPDEFYKELFRLKEWQYSPPSVKRPSVVGYLTNDIVYDRLAPGILAELKKIIPKDEKGRRKHKFHQRLTENVGHPKLAEHLSNVITLMKASASWNGFYRLVQRALPRYSQTLELPFNEDDLD
jgi:hypothetical protein